MEIAISVKIEELNVPKESVLLRDIKTEENVAYVDEKESSELGQGCNRNAGKSVKLRICATVLDNRDEQSERSEAFVWKKEAECECLLSYCLPGDQPGDSYVQTRSTTLFETTINLGELRGATEAMTEIDEPEKGCTVEAVYNKKLVYKICFVPPAPAGKKKKQQAEEVFEIVEIPFMDVLERKRHQKSTMLGFQDADESDLACRLECTCESNKLLNDFLSGCLFVTLDHFVLSSRRLPHYLRNHFVNQLNMRPKLGKKGKAAKPPDSQENLSFSAGNLSALLELTPDLDVKIPNLDIYVSQTKDDLVVKFSVNNSVVIYPLPESLDIDNIQGTLEIQIPETNNDKKQFYKISHVPVVFLRDSAPAETLGKSMNSIYVKLVPRENIPEEAAPSFVDDWVDICHSDVPRNWQITTNPLHQNTDVNTLIRLADTCLIAENIKRALDLWQQISYRFLFADSVAEPLPIEERQSLALQHSLILLRYGRGHNQIDLADHLLRKAIRKKRSLLQVLLNLECSNSTFQVSRKSFTTSISQYNKVFQNVLLHAAGLSPVDTKLSDSEQFRKLVQRFKWLCLELSLEQSLSSVTTLTDVADDQESGIEDLFFCASKLCRNTEYGAALRMLDIIDELESIPLPSIISRVSLLRNLRQCLNSITNISKLDSLLVSFVDTSESSVDHIWDGFDYWKLRSFVLFKLGRFEEALQVFEGLRIKVTRPSEVDCSVRAIEVMMLQCYSNQRRISDGVSVCSALLKESQSPIHSVVLLSLAKFLVVNNQYCEAEESIRKALNLDFWNKDCWCTCQQIHEKLGNHELVRICQKYSEILAESS